jgi:hypothetical protein
LSVGTEFIAKLGQNNRSGMYQYNAEHAFPQV